MSWYSRVTSAIKSKISKGSGTSSGTKLGTVFIKPSEESQASSIARTTGSSVTVAKTGTTYSPSGVRTSGGSSVVSSPGIVQDPIQPATIIKTTRGGVTDVATSSTINVLRSGGVKVGGTEFVGSAVVTGTGKTADQIRREALIIARKQHPDKKIGQGQFTAKIPFKKKKITTTDIEPKIITAQLREQQFQKGQQAGQSLLLGGGGVTTGTEIRTDIGRRDLQVYSPGTIYQTQVGTFPDGQPIVETYTVQPSYGSEVSGVTDRNLLARDIAIRKNIAEITRPDVSYSKFEVASGMTKTETSAAEKMNKEIATELKRELYSKEKFQDVLTRVGFTEKGAGVVTAVVPSTKGEIGKDIFLYGVGYGVGFGVKVGAYGLAQIPKYGTVAAQTFKVGTYGVGVGLTGYYGYGKYGEYKLAPTEYAKGEVIGGAFKDLTLMGVGGYKGSKGFDIVKGLYTTRGMPDVTKYATDPLVESGERGFVEISKGKFSKLSPIEKAKLDVQIFKQNKELQNILGVKEGGFHAAAKDWTTLEISRAVHIAPKASTRFLGLGGKGSYKLFPSYQDLVSVPGKPGLMWLETPGGIKPLVGTEITRGTYVWKGKLGSGTSAYAPGTKPEIQAVFDPKVTKGFEPVPYKPGYIVTSGVRVPVVGAYKPVSGTGTNVVTTENILGSGYSGYTLPSIVNVEAGLGLSGYKISSTSYTPTSYKAPVISSIVSKTPSYKLSFISSSSYPVSSSISSYIKSRSVVPSSSSVVSSSVVPSSSIAPSVSKVSSSKVSSKSSVNSYLSSVTSGSSSGKSYTGRSPYTYPKTPIPIIPKFKQPKFQKPRTKKFLVEVRRFGKFKPVGFAKTKGGALKIGRDIVSRSLARTFKISGTGIGKVPGFRAKKEKGGLVFIEPSKRALGTKTELGEIFSFKRAKKKKKVKGGKK